MAESASDPSRWCSRGGHHGENADRQRVDPRRQRGRAFSGDVLIDLLGFTPMETLVAATRQGAEIMGCAEDLGQVKPGYLADLVLVDGDPLADIKRM